MYSLVAEKTQVSETILKQDKRNAYYVSSIIVMLLNHLHQGQAHSLKHTNVSFPFELFFKKRLFQKRRCLGKISDPSDKWGVRGKGAKL